MDARVMANQMQQSPAQAEPLLSVRDLEVFFRHGRGWLRVIDGVSFDVAPGETVGIVGESGSGKTVTGRRSCGLLPHGSRRGSTGASGFEGAISLRSTRRRCGDPRPPQITMIFQEPMTALDPVFTVGEQIAETMRTHAGARRRRRASAPSTRSRTVGIPRRAARRRISAPALRRHAPARHDRDGARPASRGCSSPTSRPRRSTSPSRPRSSTLLRELLRATAARRCCSSPTTSAWSRECCTRMVDDVCRAGGRGAAGRRGAGRIRCTPIRRACCARCRAARKRARLLRSPAACPRRTRCRQAAISSRAARMRRRRGPAAGAAALRHAPTCAASASPSHPPGVVT